MSLRAIVYGRQSSGKAKSIKEQLVSGHGVITFEGWTHAGDYSDGTSASRHSTKKRDDWTRLLSDLKNKAFDVIILWEPSRGDRKPGEWLDFLADCRDLGILVHVVMDDRTYNMDKVSDWKTLAHAGVDSAAETDLLSIRVKRGHAGAAGEGKPPGGPTPFGYRRTFDPTNGKRTGQQPFEAEAVIVREIFDRVAGGYTVLGLANDLTDRRVPRTTKGKWSPSAIRNIIRNPAYIAVRHLNGIDNRGTWEPIVSEGIFHAANRMLSNPERRITRPGRQKHLLSYLATCAVCDNWINHVADCYRCLRGCVSIPKAPADDIVTEAVLFRLSRTDGTAAVASDDGGEELRARQDGAARLRDQLDQWRQSALRGETTPATLAVIEAGLTAQIADADVQIRSLMIPAPLREILDPSVDVRVRWAGMTTVSRRMVIASLCAVKVDVGRPGRRPGGVDEIKWNAPRLGKSRWHDDTGTWARYDDQVAGG